MTHEHITNQLEAFLAFIQPFKNRAYTQDTADEIMRRVLLIASASREDEAAKCYEHDKTARAEGFAEAIAMVKEKLPRAEYGKLADWGFISGRLHKNAYQYYKKSDIEKLLNSLPTSTINK